MSSDSNIERHVYGEHRYPAQLVIQDVRTIHGRQFKDASLIVASPPCQEYSYMAMPFSRGKQVAKALRDEERCGGTGQFPDGWKGSRSIAELNELFNACFRIQFEASAAAGRPIPMVVENVKGAQPWVGRARWSYGSYYLWGDVPALMPLTFRGEKVPGFRFDGSGGSFQTAAVKNEGGSWFNIGSPGQKFVAMNPDGRTRSNGTKQGGSWFHDASPGTLRYESGNSPARKAASARIAKIPFAVAQHVAHTYYPASRSPVLREPQEGE